MSNLGIPGCTYCADGILHTHCEKCGHPGENIPRGSSRTAERELCKRWLDWAENWGDEDMKQELIASTRGELLS